MRSLSSSSSSSSLHFAWGIAEAKCILVTAVCVFVCLTVPRRIPTVLHRPGCKLGKGCPLVVHIGRIYNRRCTGFLAMTTQCRTRNVSECLYSIYAWLLLFSEHFLCGNSTVSALQEAVRAATYNYHVSNQSSHQSERIYTQPYMSQTNRMYGVRCRKHISNGVK